MKPESNAVRRGGVSTAQTRVRSRVRRRLTAPLLGIVLVVFPASVLAHGGGGGTAIDEHHSNLRDALQTTLGAGYDASVEGLESADVTAGEALYGIHCASCHGDGGLGDGAAGMGLDPLPSDLTNGDQMNYISDAGYMQVLSAGLEGTAMPGYETVMSETERLEVYAYTKTLRVTTSPDDGHACQIVSIRSSTPAPLLMSVGALGIGLMIARRRPGAR